MKKSIRVIPLILILLILSSMIGCGNKDSLEINKKDVREIVWTQLSKVEQNEIIGTWEDAKIEKNVTEENISNFVTKNGGIIVNEVYMITFKSKNQLTTGIVKKLVDIKSNKIIGTVSKGVIFVYAPTIRYYNTNYTITSNIILTKDIGAQIGTIKKAVNKFPTENYEANNNIKVGTKLYRIKNENVTGAIAVKSNNMYFKAVIMKYIKSRK